MDPRETMQIKNLLFFWISVIYFIAKRPQLMGKLIRYHDYYCRLPTAICQLTFNNSPDTFGQAHRSFCIFRAMPAVLF